MNDGSRDATWERLEKLFAAALEQPAQNRTAFVSGASDDPALRERLLALLRAHERRGRMDSISDLLRRPGLAAGPSFSEVRERLRAGLPPHYVIDRELGRGGMAFVLLARDQKHHRPVAIKVLHPVLALSIGPTRFLREIAIAAKLTHPHILPLHDSGEAGGLLYYVMPYVEGESLRERLERSGPLPLDIALHIAKEVADALSYAHSHDVVHRDIKPENILFQAGHAVVSDFGIARAMTAAGGDGLSEIGVVLGTPAYMSPEQALAARDLDARTDVYALGCVVYEMLVGRPPFDAPDVEEVLRHHVTMPPPPLQPSHPGVPAAVEDVVRRALSKDRNDRFASAAEFAAALIAACPSDGAPSVAVRTKRRPAVLIGALALVAITGGMWTIARRARPPESTSVVAVLPLVPTTRDSMLERLGRDLVVTLSSALDGVRGTRTVDALTILAQTGDAGTVALQPGMQLAELLGATGVVHGALAREGTNVRIDVGLFRVRDGTPVARASITADSRDIAALTDSLSARLVRDGWRTRTPDAAAIERITTASLPALQSFLEGEHAFLESRWQDAAQSYARAIAADSTFWLAYWRYAYAREWYLNLDDKAIVNAVKAHRQALPERERLVFESWLTDTIPVALARAREATERYPDYWPGWMQYGDWLFHGGPVYGHDLAEAQAALEHAVALNPDFTAAWEHLLWVTLAGTGDTSSAARALAALQRLEYGRALTAELGFDVTRVYRLELGFLQSRVLNRALLDSIAEDLLTRARVRVGGGVDLPPVQIALSQRVLSQHPRSALRDVHERLLATAWAARGAWDSALAVADRHVRHNPADAVARYRLAVLGVWLEALPAQAAEQRRVQDTGAVTECAWLDGVLAAAYRDRHALADARTRVQRADTLPGGVLDGALAAFDRELAGDRPGAAAQLAALNWERRDVLAPGYASHPLVIAISRLAAGHWLAAQGDSAAGPPLMWFRALWALDGYREVRRLLIPFADLERGRLEQRRGNVDAARAAYAAFLNRYDAPIAAHRSLVDEARAALLRLSVSPRRPS